MIHYHGTAITPVECAIRVLRARHAFISYEGKRTLGIAIEFCQSFALDNGAFAVWRRGMKPDWDGYYEWVSDISRRPNFDFAIVPDTIDGTEKDNDALIKSWPLRRSIGVPVWHLHESLDKLRNLAAEWDRVALGSSGDYATVGSTGWWLRIRQAMDVVCDEEGFPKTKLHGLRMLNPRIFGKLPLSSADSTNVAQNKGTKWGGRYEPATPGTKAVVIAERVELSPAAIKWSDKND